MFFSQKISRGLGEKCSIILYSDKSKIFEFQDKKIVFDPNDFTDINVINNLNSQLIDPPGLSQDKTLFSPAIKELEKRIKMYSNENPNPILVLFLTDGKPEPRKLDPREKIEKNLQKLMNSAKKLKKQLVIFTLGIGRKIQVDNELLERIAKIGRGEYHFTKDFEELTNWFENLANEFSINLRKVNGG
ncbi:MAG: VWA domain-containing protein [Candidatus Lokiarchaeota archaeon]|nr:VWA domain-containing protein [Candidatus Lokiarchaeota archaeon]